jgi:hypothetical protein
MKISAVLFVALTFAFSLAAQENAAAKWMRVEFENKNFSVAFPPNFLVDAEKRDEGQRYRVIGFQNGVKMELTVYKTNSPKTRLKELAFMQGMRVTNFTTNGFTGKKTTSVEFSKIYFESVYLASEEYYYFLHVRSRTSDKAELKRFLYSLTLGGKQLFVQTEKLNLPEETVALDTLQTSAEVTEAYARKSGKKNGKVTYEADSPDIVEGDDETLSRPPLVLVRPKLEFKPPLNGNTRDGFLIVKLKINFLANGEIGDIIVYSDSKGDFARACVEAAQKMKFVPAQLNGKNVDATSVFEYVAHVFTVPV